MLVGFHINIIPVLILQPTCKTGLGDDPYVDVELGFNRFLPLLY